MESKEYRERIHKVMNMMVTIAEDLKNKDFIRALHGVHIDVGIELCGIMRDYRGKERIENVNL